MHLQLSPQLRSKQQQVDRILEGLPALVGGPILVSAAPQLSNHRGKLLSCEHGRGAPVYAASFIRERRIVLEDTILSDANLFALILVHELFHFCWPRLSNAKRSSFSELIAAELRAGARGELGESSAVLKPCGLTKPYVLETFCDTAAFLYARVPAHPWYSLATRWRNKRARWFVENVEG